VVEAQALGDSSIDPNDFFTPRMATLTTGKDAAPATWWHGDGTYESYSDEEEKSYKYTFTTGDDGTVEIKRLGGEIMDDGSITAPVDEGTAFYDGNTLTAQVFGAEYTAELSSDGSSIAWSDGDEWSFVAARWQATKPRHRQQQQRSAGPLKTSAMTADALKGKLAISSGIKAPAASEIAATVASVTFTDAKASPSADVSGGMPRGVLLAARAESAARDGVSAEAHPAAPAGGAAGPGLAAALAEAWARHTAAHTPSLPRYHTRNVVHVRVGHDSPLVPLSTGVLVADLAVPVALGVKDILTPPCIFHY
jgi:hypothetical protein